jgi:PhnB protein
MSNHQHAKFISAVFITFSGNCKKALTFYQTCFGGHLHFQTFEKQLLGYTEVPVISGSLISEKIIIHGSDMVNNEGRKLGNYLSIYLQCKNPSIRKIIASKLLAQKEHPYITNNNEPKLIEITDAYDVSWILGVD